MYKSPVLKRAMEHLYTTEPWRSAIRFPWFKEISRTDPGYKSGPPIAFVAFVASAVRFFAHTTYTTNHLNSQYRNALDCLVTGTEEKVPFSEVQYADVFNNLYDLIDNDSFHLNHGETVRRNIKCLIEDIVV